MKTGQSIQLDRLGLRILQRLASQGRTSYSDLGRELKLSVNTVRDRILAMERRGLIRGYTAVLDEGNMGNKVHAICFVDSEKDAKPVSELDGNLKRAIRNAHKASGCHSMVLELAAPTMEDLQAMIHETLAPAGHRVDRILLLGRRISTLQINEVLA